MELFILVVLCFVIYKLSNRNKELKSPENMQLFVNEGKKAVKDAQDFWAVIKFKEDNGIELTAEELERKAKTEQRMEKMRIEFEINRLNYIHNARDIASYTLQLEGVRVALSAIQDALFILKQHIQAPLTLEKRKEWFDILGALFLRITWIESKCDCQFKLIPKPFMEQHGYEIVYFSLIHIVNDFYYEEFGEKYNENKIDYLGSYLGDDFLFELFTEDMTFEVIETMFSTFCQYALAVSNSGFTKEKQAEYHRSLTMLIVEIAQTKRSKYFINECINKSSDNEYAYI